MSSCTWLLQQRRQCYIDRHNFLAQKVEAKIVSLVTVHVIRTASLRPLTILQQIFTVWCTKLRKHFNAIVEVFYCFIIAIGLPGDASDGNEEKRSAVAARMRNKVVVE